MESGGGTVKRVLAGKREQVLVSAGGRGNTSGGNDWCLVQDLGPR